MSTAFNQWKIQPVNEQHASTTAPAAPTFRFIFLFRLALNPSRARRHRRNGLPPAFKRGPGEAGDEAGAKLRGD
jgi:hypothetical protein